MHAVHLRTPRTRAVTCLSWVPWKGLRCGLPEQLSRAQPRACGGRGQRQSRQTFPKAVGLGGTPGVDRAEGAQSPAPWGQLQTEALGRVAVGSMMSDAAPQEHLSGR